MDVIVGVEPAEELAEHRVAIGARFTRTSSRFRVFTTASQTPLHSELRTGVKHPARPSALANPMVSRVTRRGKRSTLEG